MLGWEEHLDAEKLDRPDAEHNRVTKSDCVALNSTAQASAQLLRRADAQLPSTGGRDGSSHMEEAGAGE